MTLTSQRYPMVLDGSSQLFPTSQRPEPAAQSFQYFGENGDSEQHWRRKR